MSNHLNFPVDPILQQKSRIPSLYNLFGKLPFFCSKSSTTSSSKPSTFCSNLSLDILLRWSLRQDLRLNFLPETVCTVRVCMKIFFRKEMISKNLINNVFTRRYWSLPVLSDITYRFLRLNWLHCVTAWMDAKDRWKGKLILSVIGALWWGPLSPSYCQFCLTHTYSIKWIVSEEIHYLWY